MSNLETKLKIQNINKNDIYGLKLGFSFLDKFLTELKNFPGNRVKVYDYNNNQNISCGLSIDELNNLVQRFYITFMVSEYLDETAWFIRLHDLISELTLSEKNVHTKRFVVRISDTLISLVKRNQYNEFKIEDFIDTLTRNFMSISQDRELNSAMATKFFQDLLAKDFFKLKSLDNKFVIRDNEMFLSMQYFNVCFVDLWDVEDKNIKYSTDYGIENLQSIIINFRYYIETHRAYPILVNLLKLNAIDHLERFIYDFSTICYFPKNIILNPNAKYYDEMIAMFDFVYINKLLLNQYCFTVLAVSFMPDYYFSYRKRESIMFQKNDPQLNLNPEIYTYVIEKI